MKLVQKTLRIVRGVFPKAACVAVMALLVVCLFGSPHFDSKQVAGVARAYAEGADDNASADASSGGASSDGASSASSDGSGDAADGAAEEQMIEEDLDAELNDLGDENYIDLQQTPESSALVDTDISELMNAPTSLQKTNVQVRGEVVGDALKANTEGTKYWLTLDSLSNNGEGSISVLVDQSAVGLIDTYGEYNKTGTILRVKGTFYVACPSHEGIMDIHADSVTLVQPGETTYDEYDFNKFIPGLALCALGVFLAVLYRFLAERQR